MEQLITNFHLDHENHWVADLECGHGQHMRHDPPWTERLWVTTAEGRQSRIGTKLYCTRCDEWIEKISKATIRECKNLMLKAYEEGGISGLCAEGRWELALDSLNNFDPKNLKP